MKLAEALNSRADLQKRTEAIKQRLLRNAKVQEGDEPAENPMQLLEEFERVAEELANLMQRINRTNAVTILEGQLTLSDGLARREVLKIRNAAYRALAEAASTTQDRYSRAEIKSVSTVKVSEIQQQADQLAKEYRELDTRLQAANWNTDLVE